ncbi:right-handed parallel beta-helix repeat-containing protein [Dokdonella immobilis]|uniref:CSLREA domain-containing protein n=1 Tax=Dokdonella immobilis TaxID=578942 RepID=A0A1I4WXZ6_9GAMM|nr:right-handed parallel beta-helix repeat-containing protein [Dokdonella immobilis]SFN18427.1 CSLREA domain-containing protein [Dokdonella immobilis]
MRPLIPLLLSLLLASPALATSFTVNSQADVGDDNLGDNVCHAILGLPGVCTLRAAVQEANAHAGSDTIFLTAGQVYTLTRAGQDDNAGNGDLDITDDVTILFLASGARPVVDVNGRERAFEVLNDANLTLFGFDITGGDATVAGDQSGGGVALNFASGIVQISFMRFYGNRANFGGAVYNDGDSTTISSSEFFDNESENDFADSIGSAIHNRGSITIEYSSIFANSGVGGNNAIAVSNRPPNVGVPNMVVSNSTIAENIGVGLWSEDEGNLTVRNSTIVGNTGVGLRLAGVDPSLFLRVSVIARNGATDCVFTGAPGTLSLDRYNLDSDNTCGLASGTSNYPNTNPRLTPLARHGGFTHVSWPLTNSPLIDQGHPVIGSIGCEADDQQFLDRPVDFDGNGNARCDVGSVELDSDVIFHDPFDRL